MRTPASTSIKARERQEADLADVYAAQGDVDVYSERPADAAAWYQKALQLKPDDPEILISVGGVQASLARYQEAERHFEHAKGVVERAAVLDQRKLFMLQLALGAVCMKQGRNENAEQYFLLAERGAEKQFGPKSRHLAAALFQRAHLCLEVDRRKEALDLMGRAVAIEREALPEESKEWAAYLDFFVGEYQAAGQLDKAQRLAEMSLDLMQKAHGRDDIKTTAALNNLAEVYAHQGKTGKAEQLHQEALKIRIRHLGPDHPLTGVSRHNLGGVYSAQKKYKEAEACYRLAAAIFRKSPPGDDFYAAISLQDLATVYAKQQKYEEAAGCYQDSVQILTKRLGWDHKETEKCATAYVACLNLCGRHRIEKMAVAKAEGFYKRAVTVAEQLPPPHRLALAVSLEGLAYCRANAGHYEDAESACKRAFSIFHKTLGARHEMTGHAARHWALMLRFVAGTRQKAGKKAEAEVLFRQSIAALEQGEQQKHPDSGKALDCLASFYAAEGQHAKAEPLYKRSLKVFENTLGPHHEFIAITLERYAALLKTTGRNEEGLRADARAQAIRTRLKK